MSERPLQILLVEDNPADVLVFREYLSDAPGPGFILSHVERLDSAAGFLRSRNCDVVLLDLGLQDSQGLETLTRLRAEAPDTPVLVLTGLNDEEMGLKAVQNGAQDYLLKGQVQPPLLGKAIRYAMQRHQMERIVMRAEKLQALGTLAGGIAHDFNNILLTVSGNAKLALEQLPPEHAAYSHVLEIAKAGSRAVALIKKIQSFSRQQEMSRSALQLGGVVEEALTLLQGALSPRLEVRKDLAPDLPLVQADAAQIQQIIVNLATNALDAIGDKAGQLEISASPIHVNGNGGTLSAKLPAGDYVRLSVQDTGHGMDKLTLSRIFEPFFTTKSQGRGTGMGLAIVHGIMKSHLGEITAYSEVGKGTVFNLYFPVAEPTSPQRYEPSRPTSPKGKGQHILYVDDEEPLVLLITRTLRRLGYHVSGFTDPVEAMRAFRQNPCGFHAVVTDLSMPGMSGTELAQEAIQLCPRIPVILTTGYIRPQDQELAEQIGIRKLILKPDTVEDLGQVLHNLLSVGEESQQPVCDSCPPTPS